MTRDIEERVDRVLEERVDKRRLREKDKDLIETVEEVFDHYTVESLYEIMRRLNLRKIYGVVSAGKEARVYRAIDREGKEYAVKIYLTFSSEFKKGIWKYIYGDPRFENARITSTKKLMYLWARKEYKNLDRMYRAGVRVPKPYGVLNNIIVMEFIGEKGIRAPLLREYELDEEEAKQIFHEIIKNVILMLCKAKLVHADLSEYNIMIYEGEPVIIDVAQAVHVNHPNSLDFLRKDITNIYRYFTKEVGLDLGIELEELLERVRTCRETWEEATRCTAEHT